MYCNGTKCPRSSQAAASAVSWEFTQGVLLSPGFPDWQAAAILWSRLRPKSGVAVTLQTRLILVVMSTLLLVAVALIGLGWMAQNSVEERFRHAIISRQDVLWREIVSGQLELMTANTSGFYQE